MWPLNKAVYKKSIKKQNKIQKKNLKRTQPNKKSGLYMSINCGTDTRISAIAVS